MTRPQTGFPKQADLNPQNRSNLNQNRSNLRVYILSFNKPVAPSMKSDEFSLLSKFKHSVLNLLTWVKLDSGLGLVLGSRLVMWQHDRRARYWETLSFSTESIVLLVSEPEKVAFCSYFLWNLAITSKYALS